MIETYSPAQMSREIPFSARTGLSSVPKTLETPSRWTITSWVDAALISLVNTGV